MYTTHPEWQRALQAPFTLDEIKQRPLIVRKDNTAALPANYVTADTITKRLDEVCGPFNWTVRYQAIKGNLFAELGLRCPETGEWVYKSDCGTESDFEPQKGEASDALKRSASRHGIGRFLRELPEQWITGYKGRDGKFHFDEKALEEYRQRIKQWMSQYQVSPVASSDESSNGNGAAGAPQHNGHSKNDATDAFTNLTDQAESLLQKPLFDTDREAWAQRLAKAQSLETLRPVMRQLRQEHQQRKTAQAQLRTDLENARDSFKALGEEGKFNYQLTKAYGTSSIDKIVGQFAPEQADELLAILRSMYSEMKQAA